MKYIKDAGYMALGITFVLLMLPPLALLALVALLTGNVERQ